MSVAEGVLDGGMKRGPDARTRSPLLWLAIVTMCIYLGWGIVNPVLPLYAQDFGVGTAAVGLLVASFSISSFAFDLYGGRLSDRYGARLMACLGALIVTMASVLAGSAPNFAVLLAGRALTGVGSALYVTAAMNILARTTAPARMARSMSIYQSAIMTGVAFGPSIGGLLGASFGHRVPLYCYAGLALTCAVISAMTLPARLPAAQVTSGENRSSVHLLRDSAFLTAIALAATVFLVRAGVLSTLVPLYGKNALHLSASSIGFILTISATVNLLVLPHAGRLADRVHRKVAVLVGLGAGIIGLLVLLGPQTTAVLITSMVALGVCTGYAGVSPAAIIADVSPAGRSGTAMGLYRMGVDFGSVAGPLGAGLLIDATSYRATFVLLALPLALTALLALRLQDTRLRRAALDVGGSPLPASA